MSSAQKHNFRTSQLAVFLAVFLLFCLSACQPADPAKASRRIEIQWAERQLLFVGDSSQGSIQVFHLRAAPSRIAEIRAPGRRAVRDIALDASANRIWVLGDSALDLHDAHSFALIGRIPVSPPEAVRIALQDGGVLVLIAADGTQLARINPESTLIRQAQKVARH